MTTRHPFRKNRNTLLFRFYYSISLFPLQVQITKNLLWDNQNGGRDNLLARFWTSNHATRLKANAFRREFATQSQSSPLSAPFGRAGWRCVRVQEGEKAKQKTDLLDSNCDKLRALRLSSAEFQEKFCPLCAPLARRVEQMFGYSGGKRANKKQTADAVCFLL